MQQTVVGYPYHWVELSGEATNRRYFLFDKKPCSDTLSTQHWNLNPLHQNNKDLCVHYAPYRLLLTDNLRPCFIFSNSYFNIFHSVCFVKLIIGYGPKTSLVLPLKSWYFVKILQQRLMQLPYDLLPLSSKDKQEPNADKSCYVFS